MEREPSARPPDAKKKRAASQVGNGPFGMVLPVLRCWYQPRVLPEARSPVATVSLAGFCVPALALWLEEQSALATPAVRRAARPNRTATGLAP
ncbi:hypothetical protein FW320_17100 [Azospirillum sp. Vi22]|uniref:Uncharacterized protein n=1 Tax=Azospirillum formosense TaxID=861533 RepID=A0ABX2KX22_9PROT|nr:hypothetical protein [Azospirillum baldaniorum]NUB18770.1 hypothetical protein [Azospirillum formosense]